MADENSLASSPAEPKLLGPFLGHVTPTSIKIWLHAERAQPEIYVSLHEGTSDTPEAASAQLLLDPARLSCGWVTVGGLKPDTLYYYRLWTNPAHSVPLELDGLLPRDLHFRTLSDQDDQVDFLVLSCHNPTVSTADGQDGHAVWADLPQIIAKDSNKKVRFALLVGDQVYADDWLDKILAEKDEAGRLRHYLSAYRSFWSNIHYRRILCSIPSVMIWDDHDIMDGWGSREDSFSNEAGEFKQEWQGLFDAASKAFSCMQASRNPEPLQEEPTEGFDFCFRVGKWGFAFLDLRTNRNVKKGQLMSAAQADRIRQWVEANQEELHTLFVVSPVVFSHGSPVLDDLTVTLWPWVMRAVDWFSRLTKWGSNLQTGFNKSLGDIRDDIRDSWGAKENAAQTDMMLDFLFGLQNQAEHSVGVVILCGDIHTSGYATIYSKDPAHKQRSSIPHITSSSVSYSPFNWLLEAIYRHASKTVALGAKGSYGAQISHHFCSRSAALLSVRPMPEEGDYQLKVKYYVEGFPEPHILLFDLNRTSHREDIGWVAQDKLFDRDYAPTARVNVEALLVDAARQSGQTLNWRESIVDVMKLLGMDYSLSARRELAVQWGYEGSLEDSAAMNIWLHRQLMLRFEAKGGKVPELPIDEGETAPGKGDKPA